MCTMFDIKELKLIEAGERPEFDLDKEFSEANRKYFNGKLEKIPLEYANMSGRLGVVKARVRKSGTRIEYAEIDRLVINSRYKFTREQFLSTFLHELCHVLMLQSPTDFRWSGGYHGTEWRRLADTISRKSGVPITVDSGEALFDMHDLKTPIVVMMKFKGSSSVVGCAYTTMSIWNKRGDEFMDHLVHTTNDKWVIFTTKDGRPTQFAAKSVKRPVFYQADRDIMIDLVRTRVEDVLMTSNNY
jgi:hypothetical protein